MCTISSTCYVRIKIIIIKRGMITNKLRINDSRTEFIVFRSPQLKCDLSGLSVNVGESMITQSSKVRDLGVIFDEFLNFDDHITAICRSTGDHGRSVIVAIPARQQDRFT